MRFSTNVSSLVPSATLAIRAKARRLQAQGHSVVDLSAGEPSFPTPEIAVAAAAASIQAGHTGYPPTQGIPELREAVARYMRETTAHPGGDASCVIVSAGVKQALFNVAFCLFEPGDEVLVPAPYWPTYPAVIELCGATPVRVDTKWEQGFRLEPDDLERLRTPRTRGLFINSPANPSGEVYDLDLLEALCAWAGRHGLWILSDEIYRRLYYSGRAAAPSVFDVRDRSERVVLLDGVSKTFSMPGWRIGFAVGPLDLIAKATALQSQTTSGAAGPSQYAAAGVLAAPERETIIGTFRDILDRRRRTVVSGLRGTPGIECREPEGAIYLYLRLIDTPDSLSTAERLLLEGGVACVPGEPFGTPGFLRLNYSVEDEQLAEGLDRIRTHFAS